MGNIFKTTQISSPQREALNVTLDDWVNGAPAVLKTWARQTGKRASDSPLLLQQRHGVPPSPLLSVLERQKRFSIAKKGRGQQGITRDAQRIEELFSAENVRATR